MTSTEVFLFGFVKFCTDLSSITLVIVALHLYGLVLPSGVFASKIKVITFNMLNELFISFRWFVPSVGSVHSCVLRITHQWFISAVCHTAMEILVINLLLFLKPFVFTGVCCLAVSCHVVSISQTCVSNFKIALAWLHSITYWSEHALTLGMIFESVSILWVTNTWVVA